MPTMTEAQFIVGCLIGSGVGITLSINGIRLTDPETRVKFISCMIGFAGPRVVKETTHQNLPPGFQTAEFMMEHGLVDRIVHREEMRETLSRLIRYMSRA